MQARWGPGGGIYAMEPHAKRATPGQTCECVGPVDVKCGVCAGEASLIPYLRARAGVGPEDDWRAGPMLSATR